MYQLTPRMLQHLERNLNKYHDLFSGGGCKSWELEELIVACIKSDTQAQHSVLWREAGHDDHADIQVRTNGDGIPVPLQIKSGKVTSNYLTLSGHRLGRFEGNMEDITNYLKSRNANIISVSYKKVDDDRGFEHRYQVSYIDIKLLQDLYPDKWSNKGEGYEQTNESGVIFSLRPSMSWQIWWKIPVTHIKQENPFIIR